ncbi:Fc receptor-like protein 2 [Pelobates fuscus]|uniref:Fc receptor-like protein 2 n=1 Tax=Pelobates fuscus TaxID=191477 RepID=UPI002FE486EE
MEASPKEVKEGAEMTLTCDTISKYPIDLLIAFYRDGEMVQGLFPSNMYQIQSTGLKDSGDYTCEVRTSNYNVKKRSRVLHIQIQELFSTPQMEASPKKVTEGMKMTLTCDTIPKYPTILLIAFYREGEMVQKFNSSNMYQVQSAQLENSGKYTCEVRTSNYDVKKRSRVLHIQIQELFSTPQIEASPKKVTEGMKMTLTCDTIPKYPTILLIAFYREGEMVQKFNSSNMYQVQSARLENSGKYTCEVRTSNYDVKRRSRVLHIQIQEFSTPQIKVSPQEVTECAEMTLTCDTIPKYPTDLLIAFYRDGEMVQGFNSSNMYQVQSARLGNSGNYICEVRTSNHNVKKRSRVLHIQIQELFSFPQIEANVQKMTEGAEMTLTCDTFSRSLTDIIFAFYRDGEMVQGFNSSNKYQVQSVQLENSGNYTCEVRASNYNVKKRSSILYIQIHG